MEAVPEPMTRIGEIDLSRVSVEELKTMRDAGDCVRECYRVLKRTNDSIVSEYLKRHGARDVTSRDPVAPIIDRKTNSQYWFHRNAAEDRPLETGHFHTFVQSRAAATDNMAARSSGTATGPATARPNLCHIIAIAMDRNGFPARLFAPNNWVTGGAWHTAPDICRHLVYFTIDHAEPSYPVNVWITNMLVLFRPQIRDLLTARDSLISARRQQEAAEDVLQDRRLAVTADRTIDVMRQLNAVREALRTRTVPGPHSNRIIEPANVATATRATTTEQAALPAKSTRRQAAEALQTQIQSLHDAVRTARTTARALEDQVETARRQAWQREKEHAREITDHQRKYASELARQLAETKNQLHAEFRKKLADRRAEWQSNMVARLNAARKETDELVSAARAQAVAELSAERQTESQRILADAIDTRNAAEARRLNDAKENWEDFRRKSLAERDRTWQLAFEHRVDEAVAEWRDDEDARFAQAKAQWIAERSYRDARRRTIGLWVRRVASVLLIAAVISGGVALYPIVKPVALQTWRNVVVTNWTALKANITDLIYGADDPLQTESNGPTGAAPDTPRSGDRQSFIRPVAANLRSGPSGIANVIGIVPRGTPVTWLAKRGQWAQVRLTGAQEKVGWVHASLLSDRPVR